VFFAEIVLLKKSAAIDRVRIDSDYCMLCYMPYKSIKNAARESLLAGGVGGGNIKYYPCRLLTPSLYSGGGVLLKMESRSL
jgi:hypothetical protein